MMIDGGFYTFGVDGKPMSVSPSVTDAGYARMYRTDTGEECLTNRNMLGTQLAKRFPEGHRLAGKQVFSLERPDVETPERKAFACPLHRDSERRKEFDELALPYCRKANLISLFEARQHLLLKHPREAAVIESLDAERVRREDKAAQHNLLEWLAEAVTARSNSPDGGQESRSGQGKGQNRG
jgi:hypothetical protein